MTNVTTTQAPDAQLDSSTLSAIDQLIPAPKPWWLRLAIALGAIGATFAASFAWGAGYIRAQPECCGSSSGSAWIGIGPDGRSATITTMIFNSSSRDFIVTGARADLPGATVSSIVGLEHDRFTVPISDTLSFPMTVPARGMRQIAITFTPDNCLPALVAGGISAEGWGRVTIDLQPQASWLPSIGREYTLPEPLATSNNPAVPYWPADEPTNLPTGPWAIACELLARQPG